MNSYQDEAPQVLRDFLAYHETIKAHSRKTVDEYFLDLRNFFRYMKQSRNRALQDTPWDEISILDVDVPFIRSITLTDIYGYLTYLSRDRAQQPNSSRTGYGLTAATRARKIATLRSFFNYLTQKAHLLEDNPVKELDSPKLKKTLPRYLTLDESLGLLENVDGANRERDYCILTLFLNCGLRISELIGLNLSDIQGDALRVLGKGNKVRIVYLNDACKAALERYLAVRRPIRILEVGTAVGFSALLFCEYAPEGAQITTIEKYEKRIPVARENFRRGGKEAQITLLEGDAAEILSSLTETYDFIFMDAAKGQYIHFLPDVMRLLEVGGVLVSDNVLQDGDIIESHYVVERRNRTIYKRMREYLYELKHDERLITSIVPIGDGATVSVRIK